jgi:hypothetical protein
VWTILVVAAPDAAVEGLTGRNPSVEVLRAFDGEEALEKLGRNRRIDGVLLLGAAAAEAEQVLAQMREDNPAHPPVFVPAGPAPPVPGARALPGSDSGSLLDQLVGELGA